MAVARFFKCSPDQSLGFKSTLIPDGDVLPLDLFHNSKEVYRDDTMVINHVLLSDDTITVMTDSLEEGVDPLTIEGVQALGITGSYCGMEYSHEPMAGLFWFYPALDAQKLIGQDEEGNDVFTDVVLRHSWAGADEE